MKVAARLRAGYAHPVLHRFPSLPPSLPTFPRPSSLSFSRSLTRSLYLFLSSLPVLSFSPLFPSRAAGLFSVCVPGVCTHPVQWHSGGLHSVRPPCPTLPSVGSGPRENSYVASSCRVTPSRRQHLVVSCRSRASPSSEISLPRACRATGKRNSTNLHERVGREENKRTYEGG